MMQASAAVKADLSTKLARSQEVCVVCVCVCVCVYVGVGVGVGVGVCMWVDVYVHDSN